MDASIRLKSNAAWIGFVETAVYSIDLDIRTLLGSSFDRSSFVPIFLNLFLVNKAVYKN